MESNLPLLKAEYISTTSASWQKLLDYQPDPYKKSYIRDITIELNDATTFSAYIRVIINGVKYIDDYDPISTSTKLSFGGDLVLQGKTDKPIEIYVKSDGTNTLIATCTITGVEA